LAPFNNEILTWIYRRVVTESKAKGIVPVLVFLPQSTPGSWQEETPEVLRIAESAGFVVIDLGDVFQGHDLNSYALAAWDLHPNAFGHQLIAARLYDELGKRKDLIFK
jgi:hypothetical protein